MVSANISKNVVSASLYIILVYKNIIIYYNFVLFNMNPKKLAKQFTFQKVKGGNVN